MADYEENRQALASCAAKVETEISIAWARANPQLFSEYYNKFFVDYPDTEWTITAAARPGFLTLFAARKRVNMGSCNGCGGDYTKPNKTGCHCRVKP